MESRVYAKYQRSIQHNICLWKKADIINLKSDILDAVRTFIEVNTISTKINSLWEHFSKTCQELIDKHAPSKITSVRYSQTWINTEIKRHSRYKKRLIIKRRQARRQTIGTTINPSKRNVKLNVVKHITTMSAQC